MDRKQENEQKGDAQAFRAGFVAIIGEPNVGKSTLLNCLLGQKISIVTNKPQTTRHKIAGILSTEHSQIIFLDTPGILKPKYLLHESMMDSVRAAIGDADLILFLIDATAPIPKPDNVNDVGFSQLRNIRKPVYLIISKIDLVDKSDLIPVIVYYSKRYSFREVFPVSALKKVNTDRLIEWIVRELPEHPAYYPSDSVSEHSERFFVSEIIREKIFEAFREEIPYATSVEIIDFKEQEGRKDVIEAEIYVERESQKGILVGKQGGALKEIGERARKDIEAFLQRRVYLSLHVKVREKWRQKEEWLKRLGYKQS